MRESRHGQCHGFARKAVDTVAGNRGEVGQARLTVQPHREERADHMVAGGELLHPRTHFGDDPRTI
jgi:hypothetical protein